MSYASSSIYIGHAPDLAGPDYAPLTDTVTVRFYPRGAFSHLVTIAASGPDEQRRLLQSLETVTAELRRRLAMSGAA